MGWFEQLQSEIDRAGEAAKSALDEGKLRMELHRARRRADEAAEALGYATHRAGRDGASMDAEAKDRLHATLTGHLEEVERIEADLKEIREKHRDWTCSDWSVRGDWSWCAEDEEEKAGSKAGAQAGAQTGAKADAAPPEGDAARPTA